MIMFDKSSIVPCDNVNRVWRAHNSSDCIGSCVVLYNCDMIMISTETTVLPLVGSAYTL